MNLWRSRRRDRHHRRVKYHRQVKYHRRQLHRLYSRQRLSHWGYHQDLYYMVRHHKTRSGRCQPLVASKCLQTLRKWGSLL